LAKLARAEGQQFDCAPWMHKARSMPREEFTREVEREIRQGAAVLSGDDLRGFPGGAAFWRTETPSF